MNREIKFRAWDSKSKRMFPVNAIFFKGCYRASHWLFEETVGTEMGPDDNGRREIEEESPILMQFTGLKDKNGKEIYEGDLVEGVLDSIRYPTSGCVRGFSHPSEVKCLFKIELPHGYELLESLSGGEIIGNIYENPELLGS